MPDIYIYDLDFFFTFNRFFFTLHVCSVPLRGHKNSKTVTFALNGVVRLQCLSHSGVVTANI